MPASDFFNEQLQKLRDRLSSVDAQPQLAVLGIVAGFLSGLVILVFRYLIETPQPWFLPMGLGENYEALPLIWRVTLPIIGATLLGAIFYLLKPESRQVGVVHVLNRLNAHQGHLPLLNGLIQLFGGAFAAVCGLSVGREGPAIHLGAASGSQVAQWLKLPNNSVRTLVACGTAAAISASFNTPIAGVIFSMEVIMMEYTITTFVPVILAAVTGAIVTRAVYGAEPAFQTIQVQMQSLWEIPYLILMGIIAGTLAASFTFIAKTVWQKTGQHNLIKRFMAAGILTGTVAIVAPQIMGIGYDTVNQAILGEIGLSLLVIILIAKLIVTATTVGLAIPGGLIGPTLVIGACLGATLGEIGQLSFPEHSSSTAFYAMLGMGAMMGAVLHAPLAALMALLELTANSVIILPAMLVIVTANLVCSDLFGQKSIFIALLQAQGLDYKHDPLSQALQRVGVTAITTAKGKENSFSRLDKEVTLSDAIQILEHKPRWLLVNKKEGTKPLPKTLLPASALVRYLEENDKLSDEQSINLMEIPASRYDVAGISQRATLSEAYQLMERDSVEALYIESHSTPGMIRVKGVLTRSDLNEYYGR